MLDCLRDMFGYWEGESKVKRAPSPRTDHHVGSEQFPYRLKDTDKARRHAIESGIKEIQQVLMVTMNDQAALQVAVNTKRKRLILIRTHHRNKASCQTINSDVMWLYTHYKLNRSGLKFECSSPTQDRMS